MGLACEGVWGARIEWVDWGCFGLGVRKCRKCKKYKVEDDCDGEGQDSVCW